MTSLSPTRTEQPSIEGRSVRDIVETSPELVNEVWCRKIFRQILQSLELQYTMQMPNRAITPDTVVFQENGEPLLVPALIGEPAHTEGEDMMALAGIVHYAITREPVPTAPLRGRPIEGYSESLVTAVDRSLAPDPAQRPRSIEALRDILGIVSLGPPVGAQLASARAGTAAMPRAAAPRVQVAIPAAGVDTLPPLTHVAAATGLFAGLSRWQRWALAASGGAVLAALALTMFAELRDSGSYDHIVLTLPQTGEHARDGHAAGTGNDALLAGAPAPSPARAQDPWGASTGTSLGANDSGATAVGSQDGVPAAAQAPAARNGLVPPIAPDAATAPLPPLASARHVPAERAAADTVPNGGASYRLRIQPWGVVYVDGVDRGVSPPVKRLALAPGRHTLRVANPAFQDRVLEVDTADGAGQIAVDFSDQGK
jgi:hypothetical protein